MVNKNHIRIAYKEWKLLNEKQRLNAGFKP
jgi:hypothetical protein